MATSVAVAREAEDFLKTVVAFRTVPTGKREPELLLGALDRLCAELGRATGVHEVPGDRATLSGDDGTWGLLNPEDETLVTSMRRGLARVAAAARATRQRGADRGADDSVCAALDGAELVIRGELASGRSGELARLMPSFVFLVTLPVLDQDEALDLSHRTSELIDAGREG